MTTVTFGSVCSGIEAASVAWHPLGWQTTWLAEIERAPAAVLAHHYPTTWNLGDMTAVAALVRSGVLPAPDVLVGGTPCQAFSVAGLRNSLADARGQLSLSYTDLANAIDEQRDTPAVIVWENVPGVLSTQDNAFGCFLGALAGEDEALVPPGGKWPNAGCVYGPQRTVAWRILDAQYFGVAQRRRRVFVIASARSDFDPATILFESEGMRRDIAPSREARTAVAALTANGVGTCGADDNQGQAGHLVGVYGGNNTSGSLELAPALNACGSASGRMDFESEAFAVLAFHSNAQPDQMRFDPALSASLTCSQSAAVCVAYDILGTPASEVAKAAEVHTPLRARVPGQLENSMVTVIQQPRSAVRRLTPTECERLQGFPDGYTLVPYRGKLMADGPRYKMLGNSMAVPCMTWLGRRIDAAIRSAHNAAK